MPITAQHRSTRRSLVAGLLKGLGAMSLAPAILTREADASPQLAQGRQNMRDGRNGELPRVETIWRDERGIREVRFNSQKDLCAYATTNETSILIIDNKNKKELNIIKRNFTSSNWSFDFIAGGECILTVPVEFDRERSRHRGIADVVDVWSGKVIAKINAPASFGRSRYQVVGVHGVQDGRMGVAQVLTSSPETSRKELCIFDLSGVAEPIVLDQPDRGYLFADRSRLHHSYGLAVAHFAANRNLPPPHPIKVYDVRSGQVKSTLPGNSPLVSSLAWSNSGRYLASAGHYADPPPSPPLQEEHPIWIWDVSNSRVVTKIPGKTFSIYKMEFSRSDEMLLCFGVREDRSPGQSVLVVNIKTNNFKEVWRTNNWEALRDVCWGPSANQIILGERTETKVLTIDIEGI
jgi:dipeptidyl aminopeptidase/acylaminoacyl peptidase